MDENCNLKKISDSILSYFKNNKVGQGLFLLRTINAGKFPITYYSVINILLFNEFIYSDDGHFFRLGQNGFDYLQGDESLTLSAPPFSQLLCLDKIKDKGTDFIFNELWKLIGKTDEALFYIDGPTYYNTIKPYIKGSWFGRLKDISYFSRIKTNGFNIEWPDGQDICPDDLYFNSVAIN